MNRGCQLSSTVRKYSVRACAERSEVIWERERAEGPQKFPIIAPTSFRPLNLFIFRAGGASSPIRRRPTPHSPVSDDRNEDVSVWSNHQSTFVKWLFWDPPSLGRSGIIFYLPSHAYLFSSLLSVRVSFFWSPDWFHLFYFPIRRFLYDYSIAVRFDCKRSFAKFWFVSSLPIMETVKIRFQGKGDCMGVETHGTNLCGTADFVCFWIQLTETEVPVAFEKLFSVNR